MKQILLDEIKKAVIAGDVARARYLILKLRGGIL